MMAIPTLVIAFLLVLTGIGGFFFGHPDPVTHQVGHTALIPAWVGLSLAMCGVLAFKEKARKHAMHFAAMIALLGALGDGVQLVRTILNPDQVPEIRETKLVSMSVTFVLLVVFLVLCIRSFINARKNRLAGQ